MEEDLKILPILRTLKREKFIIIFLTFLSAIVSFGYSSTIKPIFKGQFEILVRENKSNSNSFSQISNLNFNNMSKLGSGDTQLLILKSPSVLMPVFNFVKNEYIKKGIDTSNMYYKSWLKKELDIKFKDNSMVLSITYFNNDKKLISDTLDKISSQYQNFSKSSTEKELNKTIKYLETQQKILKKESIKALKDLNTYSLNNGIVGGNGLVGLSKNEIEEKNINNEDKVNMRYASQFALLENYELRYRDYSSKFKEDSEVLRSLKIKIENLKNALKRPNEILLKYRDLLRDSKTKEEFLSSIEKEIETTKLIKAKQIEPWELISQPTVDKFKVSPIKRKIVGGSVFLSLIISSLIAFLVDKKKGFLYEIDNINMKIESDYLDSIYYENKILSCEKIKNIIKSNNISKLGFSIISPENKKSNDLVKDFEKEFPKGLIFITDIFDKISISKVEKIIILIEPGKINIKTINLFNQYINLNKNKIMGWIFVSKDLI